MTPRTVTLHGPAVPELLGQPALVVSALSGVEKVGRLFDYRLLRVAPAT